ncbi:hypothetical protein [Simkania sp.]|uniref:hypothetical protein n=1 Tax=Simkania sp. TaxID=34094 RepID=UPI003B5230A0
MAVTTVKNFAQMGLETALSTAVMTTAVQERLINAPEDLVSNIVPIAGIFSGTNTALAAVMGVHEKPKLVQVAFPFFSGLVATGALVALSAPVTELMSAYVICSSMLAGVALLKVIAKAILKMDAEPKEESKPARVFSYVVVGATTFIPAMYGARFFGDNLGNGMLALMGLFFGLAQVCVTKLLGAPQQESRWLHASLPLMTSPIPLAIIGSMAHNLSPKFPGAAAVITATSILTALVGTVASRYFARQPQVEKQPAVDEKKEEQLDQRSTYRRPGFSTTLSYHSRNGGMK